MSALEDELAQQMRLAGLPEPVREAMFHPSRKWRFDFSWPDAMLAVEVDGGTWAGGRHSRGGGYTEDCVKYAEALCLGWRVLRVTGDMVQDGRALRYVEMALSQDNNARCVEM